MDEIQPTFNARNPPQPSPQGHYQEPDIHVRKRYDDTEFNSRRRYDDVEFRSRRRYDDAEFNSRRYYPGSESPRRRYYQESESPTEIVEFRRVGDEARYFNNWETAVVKDARLVRCNSLSSFSSMSSESDSFDDFSFLHSKINQIRMKNKVHPLKMDYVLTKKAKHFAKKFCLENKFRKNPEYPHNIWIGKDISPRIVDEWNEEMKNWTRHHFECLSLRKIGIAKFRQHNLYVVVAFYE